VKRVGLFGEPVVGSRDTYKREKGRHIHTREGERRHIHTRRGEREAYPGIYQEVRGRHTRVYTP